MAIQTVIVFLAIILVAIGVVQAWQINATRKHDKVLFSFRHLHDDTILFMVDRQIQENSLSVQEQLYVRMMIRQLDNFVRNFDRAKKEFFTLSMFFSIATFSAKLKLMESKKPGVKLGREVRNLDLKMSKTVINAFHTLVPFFKIRLFYQLSGIIVKLLIIIGVTRLTNIQRAFEFKNKLEQQQKDITSLAC